MKSRIIVHHHTGLGDHFICNGLIHSLLEQYSIDLICKRHYACTIKHLYEDFEDVNVVLIENEMEDVLKHAQETNYPLMRVGFEKCDYDNFEESFYTTSGMDPDVEYNKFILPKRLDGSWKWYENLKSKLGEDYIFVHDISTSGTFDLKIQSNLPRHTVVKEDTNDILDYVDAICFAKEVHVINSGIFNLVFQLYYKNMTKGKIIYHNARKLDQGGIPVKVLEGITVVEYE